MSPFLAPPFPLVALRVRVGVRVGRMPIDHVEFLAHAGVPDWMRDLARAELQRREALS